MNNVKELLPIGSVIVLKEGTKKLMIFGLKQRDADTDVEYDYIGVIYPEGNIGTGGQFFFNHRDIEEVFFTGYKDEEHENFIDRLYAYYEGETISEIEKLEEMPEVDEDFQEYEEMPETDENTDENKE